MKRQELENMWEKADVPEAKEFSGVYRITMYPRWLFWWFRNVKRVRGIMGKNYAFRYIGWGPFYLGGTADHVILDYEIGMGLSKYIIDHVRRVRGGYYIGRFYYCDKFLFWFTMKKG